MDNSKLVQVYTSLFRKHGKKKICSLFNSCMQDVDRVPIEVTLDKFDQAGLPYQEVMSDNRRVIALRATRDWLRGAFSQAIKQV